MIYDLPLLEKEYRMILEIGECVSSVQISACYESKYRRARIILGISERNFGFMDTVCQNNEV